MQIFIVANKLHTSFVYYTTLLHVIAPPNVLEPSQVDLFHVAINLQDMLVISCPKLRAINTKYAPIEISDALEAKSWVPLLPLGLIVVNLP
jgi:hypothetical protein